MKYDDAETYFLNFQTPLPNENGGRHLALFVKWAVLRGLVAGEIAERRAAFLADPRGPVAAFFEHCDGKLVDEDLNEEGNAFAAACYGDDAVYDAYADAMMIGPGASLDAVFGAKLTRERQDRML